MAQPHTPATILVVDDDPGISRLITRELERDGHHAPAVRSGEEAVDWLKDNAADLVLLDLKLPGLCGNDLIDHLDGFHDHLPFFIITTKEIDIELSTNLHRTVLSIRDKGNGRGITELDPKRLGMGLRIMKYRADMIGGILDIQRNQSGLGTTVFCTIPTSPSSTQHHYG